MSPEGNITPNAREKYILWHRRFAHLGSAKLRNLHKVTTLDKPIVIAVDHDNVCEVCALTKFKNQRNHTVSERKSDVLALVSIDICGALPTSRNNYNYFLLIVDNYSRKIWNVPLRQKSDAIPELKRWKAIVELQTGTKLQAVRSDNAPELKSILDEWCATFGIIPQYTVAYMSIQNGVVERSIQTAENSIRAMIKDAGLPIEFWVEAAQTDAYLRNRIATGPVVSGKLTSPEEAWTRVKPSIDHLRVWGCKCYSYVDVRSIPQGERRNKLMDRGRVGVFMGYVEETPKQYLLWAPDLGRVIKSHAVKFSENEIGGSIDLKMRKQTANVLPVRNPVGRPRKEPTSLYSEATLTPVIKRTVRFANEPTLTPVKEGPILIPEHELPGINHCESASTSPTGNMGQEPNSTASVAPPAPEPIATKTFSHVAVPRKEAEAQAISP